MLFSTCIFMKKECGTKYEHALKSTFYSAYESIYPHGMYVLYMHMHRSRLLKYHHHLIRHILCKLWIERRCVKSGLGACAEHGYGWSRSDFVCVRNNAGKSTIAGARPARAWRCCELISLLFIFRRNRRLPRSQRRSHERGLPLHGPAGRRGHPNRQA